MSWGAFPPGVVPWGGSSEIDLSVASPVTQLLSGDLDAVEDLLWVRPWSSTLESRVDLYLGDGWASKPGATLPTGEPLPNQYFMEVLDKAPNRELHVLDSGEISESAVPSYGAAMVSDPYKEFIATWRSYQWEGAPAVHYQGHPSWDLALFATVFRGEVSRFLPSGGVAAAIQLRDIIQKLQRQVETEVYLGFGACNKGGALGRITFGDVLDRTGSFTLRCRIWPNSGTNASTRLWNKDDGSSGWLAYVSNRNVAWQVRGASAATCTGNLLNVGVWNDVWIVYDASAATLIVYVIHDDSDDLLSESFAYATSPAGNAHGLAFGARASDGASAFDGRWDELAVFGTALTAEQIRGLRHKELLSDEAGLDGLWHCNEATGTTDFDELGVNNGTFAGGVTWAGSLTGTKAVAGKVRLGGAGIVLEREPVLLDEVDNVYEIAKGGMVGVLQDAAGYMVKDRGIRPYVYDGDFADPYAADPAVDHWMSINASGLMRLGNKPDGRLTVTAQITAATDAGGVIAILGAKVLDESEIDAGALATMTAQNPAPVSIPWGLEPSTVDQHIVAAAKSIQAWRTVDLGGRLTAKIREIPAIVEVDLYGDGSADDDIEIDGISEVHTLQPPRAIEVRFAPYETTQTATDLSSTLSPHEREDLSLAFRSYKTPENAAAVTANPSAPLVVLETRLVYEADARRLGDGQAAMRTVPLRTDLVALTKPRHDLQPGTAVRITASTLDYALGKLAVVVGKIVDDARRQHTIEVFGGTTPVAIGTDEGPVLATDAGEILVA